MRDLVIVLALIVVTAAVYEQVREHEFVNYDDPEYVTENPPVRNGLSRQGMIWAFTAVHAANWHPVTWLSHMLDCELFGLEPGPHHIVNALIHALNAALLFWLFRQASGDFWPSAFAAALFALHPLRVESVAWVSERKDVLAGLFWFATMSAYLSFCRRRTRLRYAALIVLFALGLMAKPMLVTLPFVLLLFDVWPLKRLEIVDVSARGMRLRGERVALLLVEKAPLFVLAALAALLTYEVQSASGAVGSAAQYPLGFRVGNALLSYVVYLRKALWPVDLAVFYPVTVPLPAVPVFGATLVLAVITALVLRLARTMPYAAVGWFWYLGALVPVIGLVKQGEQALADRYTYIPMIGIAVALAWSAYDTVRCHPALRLLAAGLGVVVLMACALTTRAQLRYWRDSEALFTRALAVTKNNHVAHTNLGAELMKGVKVAEASEHFEAALRIKPDYARAHVNFAVALAALGKRDDAMKHYRKALRLDPAEKMAHLNLGLLLEQEGRALEAIEHYRAALKIDPAYIKALNQLGVALASRNRLAEAIEQYRQAIALDPNFAPARGNLAVALEQSGRIEEALEAYRAAIGLMPRDPMAHCNLALALHAQGRLEEAETHRAAAENLRSGSCRFSPR